MTEIGYRHALQHALLFLAPWAHDHEIAPTADGVPIDQLLDAHWNARGGDLALCRHFAELKARYAEAHGGIADLYFGKQIRSVAILTRRHEIHLRYPSDKVAAVQPEFEEAIWRTVALAQRGGVLLEGRPRRILGEMLHSVVVYLLGVLDSLEAESTTAAAGDPAHTDRIEKALGTASRELDRLDGYLRQSAQQVSLKYYLLGTLPGVVALWLLAVAASRVRVPDVAVEPLVVTLACGGVGAVISVMTRLTSGSLSVDHNAGRPITALSGAFRPVIGAVFGLALYVLLQAGLLEIGAPPAGTDAGLYWYAAVAFVAGFSERWAQDTIVQTTSGAGGRRAPGDRPGRPAAPTPPA